MIKKIIAFACVLVLSFFTIQPLFSNGFFPMHDDVQVARVIVMAKALKNGQFPVRIVSDLGYGYGYPLFNFYGPLPYYIGGIFNLIGIDALTATKVMIGIGVVIGSVGMYILSSSIVGTFGGMLSAVLFTYFPYRAVQLYVRGAIGEIWAMSFLPLVLLGLFFISYEDKRKVGIFVAGFSLAGIILSHTVFGYVAIGSIVFFALLTFLISLLKGKRTIRSFLSPLIAVCTIALGMTAFFWLPAIAEMSYTNVEKVIGSTANYKDHYVCLSQLWNSPWGYGGSAGGCVDGMSFKLGKLHILLSITSLFIWIFSKEKNKRLNGVMIGMMLLGTVSLLLTLQISEPVWNSIPLFSFIQYPWRFLGPVGISMAFVSGYLLYKRTRIISIIGTLFFVGIILWLNSKLFIPQYLYDRPAQAYGIPEELRFRASKVSDEYLPKGIKIPITVADIVKDRVTGNESIRVKKIWETEIGGKYEIEADSVQELKLHMAFFPGWKYIVNGKEVKPNVVGGEPSVVLSAGYTLLEMRFSDTLVRKVGNGLTLITILGIVVFIVYGKKTIGNHRHTRL